MKTTGRIDEVHYWNSLTAGDTIRKGRSLYTIKGVAIMKVDAYSSRNYFVVENKETLKEEIFNPNVVVELKRNI